MFSLDILLTKIGLIYYWLPFSICFIGYTYRTVGNYRTDVQRRGEARSPAAKYAYIPTDTIGTVIGRLVITCTPILNILAAVFDIGLSFLQWLNVTPVVSRDEYESDGS